MSLYDGVCTVAKKLERLSGEMTGDRWVYSSSGRNMFVSFDIGRYGPNTGFDANIHKGNEFKIYSSQHKAMYMKVVMIQGRPFHTSSDLPGDLTTSSCGQIS